MDRADIKLFGDAVLKGITRRFEKEMSQNDENDLCSEAHVEAMLEIVEKTNLRENKRSRVGLIAALIAAALLLIGCTAYVYRNQIGSFVEYVFEEYVNIAFLDDDKEPINVIEDVYELSYVPDKYLLTDSFITDIYVKYTYTDQHGNAIIFDQYPLGNTTNINIDNDIDDVTVIVHNGVEFYVRTTEITKHYVWHNDKYSMTLVLSKAIGQEEALKIIDGIK